jgi:hypothetical protein
MVLLMWPVAPGLVWQLEQVAPLAMCLLCEPVEGEEE